MSLFVSISNLQNYHSSCPCLNLSDTIERECLSVLHKLHDQVNGLQLVQVVVQPLAKLFNPASLAALSANISNLSTLKQANTASNVQYHGHNTNNSVNSNASTPSSYAPPTFGPHHSNESDGATILCDTSHNIQHSRSHSFASSFAGSSSHIGAGNNSMMSSTSTYMMSPDTAQALIARLDTDRDVNWLMEIIGYGLSMPFSLTGEQDSVKDCCTIYCEWLAAALLPYNEHNEDTKYQQLSKLVPVPIKKEPNRYARKMLSHLYNVFLPRSPPGATLAAKSSNQKDEADAILTAVSRQAVLCHRVLRTIESIAHNRTNLMDDATWNHLLALLLSVNDKLLSPPTEPDDIGTQLQDRILGVLFDLMLLACSRSIPDSSLWRTFHEMCLNWRHRPALIEHWKRITLLLTKRIVSLPKNISNLANYTFDSTSSGNLSAIESSILSMNYESLSQTWYRFLNLLGNPAELSDPTLISRTDEFYHANSVLDPRHHPCLNILPQVFYSSMLGLRDFVESFLGSYEHIDVSSRCQSQLEHNQQVDRFRLNPDRPKCNSLLHIFGDWLFSSALIGSDLYQDPESSDALATEAGDTSGSMTSMTSSMTATEMEVPNPGYSPAFRRKQSNQSTTSSHASMSTADRRRNSKQLDSSVLSSRKITLESSLTAESFEAGQAEAMSILCKIFISKSSLEDMAPAYLARFYLCLQHCLNFGIGSDVRSSSGAIKRQLLASVLVNSTELLQKDLDGINLLIPAFIKAIELVFECHEKDAPVQPPPRQHSKASSGRQETNMNQSKHGMTSYDLRRACILTLVNLLAYPPHFKDLGIRSCLDNASPMTTFQSLQPRLMKLLFVALQTETDPTNMQILFGGLSLAIYDLESRQSYNCDDSKSGKSRNEDTVHHDIKSEDHIADSDDSSHSSFVLNSIEGFLTKSLHVTCYLLINTWRHDNSVSLAALEVLTSVARVSATSDYLDGSAKSLHSTNNNVADMKAEYMQTTRWVCDYISNQCSRPPPAHSRDMHSTIVAAYQCLAVWFYNHPSLLSDENCMSILMEVIELGVSGQKSKTVSINPAVGVATQTIVSKGEKLLKPSSMRVREAAEALLNVCLVRTCHDGIQNIALCDTTLDENTLIQAFGLNICKSINKQAQNQSQVSHTLEPYKSFKYFSDENSIIFSFLESYNHELSNQDYVICLMRTPFGKHCWRFDFNYCSGRSREMILANRTIGLMKRPFQQNSYTESGIPFTFHKGHNRSIYFNKDARFFPENMDNLPSDDLDRPVTSLDDYVKGNASRDLIPPQFLGNSGKMSKIFSHQVLAEQKVVSEIAPSRESGRRNCEEPMAISEFDASRILATHLGLKTRLQPIVSDDQKLGSFVSSIKSLDNSQVRTCDLINIFYVRRNKTSLQEILDSTREDGAVNVNFLECLLKLGRPSDTTVGPDKSLSMSWIDMCQELIFNVPTRIEAIADSFLNVYWLESADDIASIPSNGSHEKSVRFFICPMASGLFRVDLSVKYLSPLVDGMILRKSSLSGILREAISNWCRRRRLDADSYQTPHVKRRLLLSEICNNYR